MLSPDLVNYLIFASSVADNFVKGDDFSPPILDDVMVEPLTTGTVAEIATGQEVAVDPTYSPVVTTSLSHEQSYPEVAVGTAVRWSEGSEGFIDQSYTERRSLASPEDPASPVVSDGDSFMTQEFASESSPFTPYSPFQSPTCTFEGHLSVDSEPKWQYEFATGSLAYVQDSGSFSSGYQPPNYIPDSPNSQRQRTRAQWLAANHEQISRDLGKSPLFSPFIVNHPRSPTPTFTDRFLRYSTNSSIHHPRPVKSPNFPLHQILCYSPSIALSSRDPPPVAYVSETSYLRSDFSPNPTAEATEFM